MSKKTSRRRRDSVTKETIQRKEQFKYQLLLQGAAVGVLVGIVVGMFRFALQKAEEIRNLYIAAAAHSVLLTVCGILILLFCTAVVVFCLKREPLCSGSGIPQVKGELRGHINANWLQVILAKFLGGVAAIGGGLSLGREGPSIQLGAMVGKGFSRLTNRLRTEEKLLMSCGAGAGLAAAFSAPLAGVVFVLEEMHKNFSKEVLLSTMAAAVCADCIVSSIFGLSPVFHFEEILQIPLSRYWMVALLGILLGAFGVFYNRTISFMQDFYGKLKPIWMKAAVPLVMVVALAFLWPEMLGSGHHLVGEAASGLFSLKVLAAILVVKFLFSGFSFGTGAPGGIFLPLLVLGSISGGLFTEVLSPLLGFEESYISNFVILGMAGYFSAIVRAPITGIILISEMTGSLNNLLGLSLVSLMAYLTAELMKGQPVYDQLLNRMLEGGISKKPKRSNKVLIESEVYLGSQVAGRSLAEISLPAGCLVVSILRDEKEFVPNGSTVLESGDKLILLCDEAFAAELEDKLDQMCKSVSI
ncbi:MAG: ClC family H(+)/Cl(-) exchange transporter [Firmicutes bacterium]|nr:ClC family H(+)/Cl(-) exchange transporter [Bacillota bacterium]MDD7602764.1 ClC family H(+)/Cl(-) exchange transporter [Bacillota bacterium]MDY5856697.1 ClC family H(+)/Cl(-) exchange transporter [Anaerovoracaceae bacterium]